LVGEIVAGHAAAYNDLCESFRGLRYFFLRQVGPLDGDELNQQTIADLFMQIRRGALREPERLPGYVRAMAQRKVAMAIHSRAKSRAREVGLEDVRLPDVSLDPESAAIKHQQVQIAKRILNSLPRQNREVLVRFYLHRHSPEQIQADLNLTENQFRLIKSRAKARFSELCRARLGRRRAPGRASEPTASETTCHPAPSNKIRDSA
jgi:RNA polymerase sigma factor (sigma-70 family)